MIPQALLILQNVTQSQSAKMLILSQQPILERLKAIIVCTPVLALQ